MPSVHGHKILDMIIHSGEYYTIDSLILSIEKKFGKNRHFHTCSEHELTATELVTLLEKRGKFIQSNNGVIVNKKNTCNHS